ncbi:MAG: undecaprenyl/decaprenyl-phosphate alpha-N-acetylglucosaminyl 1-phosphate transferase [Delftia sp.]|nr:undecaprenyl/decaprenyl-phosphate alpha-N-acetylglucosaminyl 1-phosphate transferase [Delftia sp.]
MSVVAAMLAGAVAMAISFLAVRVTTTMAHKFGMIDRPVLHKAHARPTPLLGGCAIFAGILLPTMLAMSLASVWAHGRTPSWVPIELAVHIEGAAARVPQALGILACAFVLHVIGIVDDRKNLGPWLKLIAQLAVCSVATVFLDVRVLTVAGEATSCVVTVLWLVTITNAFNFLDNMDGLSAGVAAICAAALLASAASMGQLFVMGWLCVILGSLVGFLPHNYPPARVFMGDAGSLVVGFLLGVVSCLTTYVQPGGQYCLHGVFVPLVVMAVPLYDMVSVVSLRLRDHKSPMVGDRRHFSHRLVRRGMSVRKAVLTIYLCTGATAVAASLLPRVGTVGAVLVFAQTVAILLVIALLESSDPKAPKP